MTSVYSNESQCSSSTSTFTDQVDYSNPILDFVVGFILVISLFEIVCIVKALFRYCSGSKKCLDQAELEQINSDLKVLFEFTKNYYANDPNKRFTTELEAIRTKSDETIAYIDDIAESVVDNLLARFKELDEKNKELVEKQRSLENEVAALATMLMNRQEPCSEIPWTHNAYLDRQPTTRRSKRKSPSTLSSPSKRKRL
jgi:hypothetical protein